MTVAHVARLYILEYWAVVLGVPAAAGTVDAPIGRDPRNTLRSELALSGSTWNVGLR